MTATEAIANAQTCPAWCAGCLPEPLNDFGHMGRDRTVELSLMPPEMGDDILHRQPWHEAAKVVACLEQRRGAALPTINLRRGEGASDEITLTLVETMHLVGILGELIQEGRASVSAAAARERSDR